MSQTPDDMQVSLDLELLSPQGDRVRLGDVLAFDLTVVQLVRYFGCLPCQEWLIELDRRAGDLARQGIGAAAVGGSADYQAVWLREQRGVNVPLLLDPSHEFRAAVEATRPLGWRMLDPRGATAYARSLAHGYRPQAVTHDTVRSPAVLVLDRTGTVRWRFVGTRIGHYPLPDEVDEALAKLR